MTEFRCRPHSLSMGNSSPYAQRYDYGSVHPMSAMLTARYFLTVSGQLRAGDEIHINRHQTADSRSRILEYAAVRVVEGGKNLEFAVITPPVRIQTPEEREAERALAEAEAEATKPKAKKAA